MHAGGPQIIIFGVAKVPSWSSSVGRILDLSAMPQMPCLAVLAGDVPDFLRNTWSFGGNGILDGNCVLISRPVNWNGIQACFSPKCCSVYGDKYSHRWDRCRVSYEDLHAANADLLAAEAGGAYLGRSICEYMCTCKLARSCCILLGLDHSA